MMGEGDDGRPLRFTPGWPPMKAPKPVPKSHPGASMVFRKSSWPPPTAEEVSTLTGQNVNGDSPDSNNSDATQNNPSQQTPSENNKDSNALSNQKPKRAVKDYSSHFGKNAAPPTKPAYILQPGGLKIPDKFSGNPEEDE